MVGYFSQLSVWICIQTLSDWPKNLVEQARIQCVSGQIQINNIGCLIFTWRHGGDISVPRRILWKLNFFKYVNALFCSKRLNCINAGKESNKAL